MFSLQNLSIKDGSKIDCMLLKPFLFCFAILFSTSQLFAATTNDQYQGSFNRNGNTISFETKNGKYQIEACKEDLFRIRYRKTGAFESPEPWMVIQYQWDAVNLTVAETATGIQIKTAKLQLQINKQPFQIKILDAAGKLLNADAGSTNQAAVQINADTVSMQKVLQAGEHVFGFGSAWIFWIKGPNNYNSMLVGERACPILLVLTIFWKPIIVPFHFL
jgi:alpha-glucosidase (family GH31 glycosyl hydrolase)